MTPKEAIKDIEENIKPIVGGQSLELAIKALKIIDCPQIQDECFACLGCGIRMEEAEKADIKEALQRIERKTQAPENSLCPKCRHLNACGRDVNMIVCSEYEPAVAPIKPEEKVARIEKDIDLLEFKIKRLEEIFSILGKYTTELGWNLNKSEQDLIEKNWLGIYDDLYGDK